MAKKKAVTDVPAQVMGTQVRTTAAGDKMVVAEAFNKVPVVRPSSNDPSLLDTASVTEDDLQAKLDEGWKRGITLTRDIPGRPAGRRESKVVAVEDAAALKSEGWREAGDEADVKDRASATTPAELARAAPAGPATAKAPAPKRAAKKPAAKAKKK